MRREPPGRPPGAQGRPPRPQILPNPTKLVHNVFPILGSLGPFKRPFKSPPVSHSTSKSHFHKSAGSSLYTRGGRPDGIYICVRFGGPPEPIRTPLPGPRIDPQGPGTRSPGHPESFPDRHKIEERPIKIQKHSQTSRTNII